MKYIRKRFTTPSDHFKDLWHSLITIKNYSEGIYHTKKDSNTGSIVYDIDSQFFQLSFKTYVL